MIDPQKTLPVPAKTRPTGENRPQRLDLALLHRGLVESREQARRLILAGEVWVDGQRWDKASRLCRAAQPIELRGSDRYVGRGGHKLAGALLHFGLPVAGTRCLDLGASTGGFTDCLLQAGAASVVALDVGHGQLHWKLRQDARVRVIEHFNARELDRLPPEAGSPFDLIVADLSFISLRLVLPGAFAHLVTGGSLCALIKPQFEAGRAEVGKGGIVRDPAVRQRVVAELGAWATAFPVTTRGVIASPLPGRDGNQEFLWLLQKS